jgi:hypothetical protein
MGARCGVVDLLDFPLDPPDGLSVRYGGRGFGGYRDRYDQYHAGEDWQLLRGQANLGVPVYAIGHGEVTYAQPYGWGLDAGVVIIRHTFADGRTVLSFYGHMAPESVTLRVGDCVRRGEKIAEIGQPKTPPHLHFEIRTHMPDEPGPGYWPADPTTAGWLAPSAFVWRQRMAAMPGVVWIQPAEASAFASLTGGGDGEPLGLAQGKLTTLSPDNGTFSPSRAVTETANAAVYGASGAQLFLADRMGQLFAYPATSVSLPAHVVPPRWQVQLETIGLPSLMPLPDGGVVAVIRSTLIAVSPDGQELWRETIEQRPDEWLLMDELLLLTTSARDSHLYSVTADGLEQWPVALTGQPVRVGDSIWLYASDGLYSLDPAVQTAARLVALPDSHQETGSILPLPTDGALVAHRQWGDRRLILFASDATAVWDRSIATLGGGQSELVLHAGKPYLLVVAGSDMTTQLKLYAVDTETPSLCHIFTGGSRTPTTDYNWIRSVGDLLIVNVGGGAMVGLDPSAATAAVCGVDW